MIQPMTAQMRSVASVSSLQRDDFSWSTGTSQAPMAGVAVLRRFSCLPRTTHRAEECGRELRIHSVGWSGLEAGLTVGGQSLALV